MSSVSGRYNIGEVSTGKNLTSVMFAPAMAEQSAPACVVILKVLDIY